MDAFAPDVLAAGQMSEPAEAVGTGRNEDSERDAEGAEAEEVERGGGVESVRGTMAVEGPLAGVEQVAHCSEHRRVLCPALDTRVALLSVYRRAAGSGAERTAPKEVVAVVDWAHGPEQESAFQLAEVGVRSSSAQPTASSIPVSFAAPPFFAM